MIVHLDRHADRERNGRPSGDRAGPRERAAHAVDIDDHAIGKFEVGEPARDHERRSADQRRIVKADQRAALKGDVGEAHARIADIERHRPSDAIDAAHAADGGVGEWLDIAAVLHMRIHHPEIGEAGIAHEAVGHVEDAEEQRRLLRHEERGEGQAKNEAEIFAAIAEQHPQRDGQHWYPPLTTERIVR